MLPLCCHEPTVQRSLWTDGLGCYLYLNATPILACGYNWGIYYILNYKDLHSTVLLLFFSSTTKARCVSFRFLARYFDALDTKTTTFWFVINTDDVNENVSFLSKMRTKNKASSKVMTWIDFKSSCPLRADCEICQNRHLASYEKRLLQPYASIFPHAPFTCTLSVKFWKKGFVTKR